jgi:uncharacterized membrane protein
MEPQQFKGLVQSTIAYTLLFVVWVVAKIAMGRIYYFASVTIGGIALTVLWTYVIVQAYKQKRGKK